MLAMELSLGRLGAPDPTRWRCSSTRCPSCSSLSAPSSALPPRARRPRSPTARSPSKSSRPPALPHMCLQGLGPRPRRRHPARRVHGPHSGLRAHAARPRDRRLPGAASPSPLSFLRFAQQAMLTACSPDPDAPVPPALLDALLACICRFQAAASVLNTAAAAAGGGRRRPPLRAPGRRRRAERRRAHCRQPLHRMQLLHPAISGFCHLCPRLLYLGALVCCCSSPRIYAPTTASCRSASQRGRPRRVRETRRRDGGPPRRDGGLRRGRLGRAALGHGS